MSEKSANDRVYWHSRRGMLEIDLALMPFSKEVYPTLDEADKAIYRRLLEEEDTTLFAWVLQREKPEEEDLARMMESIINYAKSNKS